MQDTIVFVRTVPYMTTRLYLLPNMMVPWELFKVTYKTPTYGENHRRNEA